MATLMTREELKQRTDDELLTLWKSICGIFKDKNNIQSNEQSVAGLLNLSKETERRGLQLVETKFGKIILEPKK